MPFTASHIAAVLPLVRTPLIPSALVVGSMTPDLPYFFPLFIPARVTHAVVGVVAVDVALGAVALVVWHLVLAEPLWATAPRRVRERIARPRVPALGEALRIRQVLLTYVSLAIGAGTHVIWDAFTHARRWGGEHIDWLVEEHGPLYGHTWTQYGSTLAGAAVVAVWLARWWRRTPRRKVGTGSIAVNPRAGLVGWLIAGTVTLTVISPLVVDRGTDLHRTAFVAVTVGIGVALAVAVLLAIAWHLLSARTDPDPHHTQREASHVT